MDSQSPSVCFQEMVEDCPGRYCGRVFNNDPNGSCYSECEACPEGYRVLDSSLCVKCGDAVFRDYLFLGFICLVSVTVRLTIIEGTTLGRPIGLIKLGAVALSILENVVAMLWTLLVLEPTDPATLMFYSCKVTRVSDFYPIFYNPTEDYVHQLHCSYEVAYPLYRMIFIFFAFSFLCHLVALPLHVLLIYKFKKTLRSLTEFCWLIAFPVLVCFFAVFAGLLYFAFDYLLIVVSMGSYVTVSTITQLTKFGFKNPFRLYKSVEHWCFTVTCLVCLTYGIISLTDAGSIALRAKVLPIVLAPPLLHPILSYIASPQAYLVAWGLKSYRHFYEY